MRLKPTTIRAILCRAAAAEDYAVNVICDGYIKKGLDSGYMEDVVARAFSIFQEREMPDVAEDAPEAPHDVYYDYGDNYLGELADRAIAALDALDIVIETVSDGDFLEQQFIQIRALLEELAPDPVPVVVPAPDVVPVQEPLAFPDNGK
jgi:hypothetical protein